jgi:hypothetical protein
MSPYEIWPRRHRFSAAGAGEVRPRGLRDVASLEPERERSRAGYFAATRGATEALDQRNRDAQEKDLFRNSTDDVEVAAAGSASTFWV